MSVIEQALNRAMRARQHAGSRGTLVIFGTVGIQTVLGASRYQHGIRGGSEKLKNFAQLVEDTWGDSVVYAGGGQGLLLLPAAVAVEAEIERLRQLYEDHVPLGQLAIGQVPWSPATEPQALGLLAWAGRIAKEEAPLRFPPLPPRECRPADLCQNCHATPANGGKFTTGEREEGIAVCKDCRELMDLGLNVAVDSKDDRSPDLARLSPPTSNRLATLAADGNRLGQMFGRLKSLEQRAIASAVVARVFGEALEHAERAAGTWYDERARKDRPRTLTLISGGDDLRVWLDPSVLVVFVDELTARLHQGFEGFANQLRPSDATLAEHLNHVGIGIGAVVGPDTYPALRFGEVAKLAEDRAKAACRKHKWRSGIDLTFLTTGEEDPEAKQQDPLELAHPPHGWRGEVRRANALRSISGSQRSALFALQARIAQGEDGPPQEEVDNYFRYQVARARQDKEWRLYLHECGVDARTAIAEEVARAMPTPWHDALAECLTSEKEARREAVRT